MDNGSSERPLETQTVVRLGQELKETNNINEGLVMAVAEKMIQEPIPLITDKEVVAPSGDKRDYVSLTPY